MDKKIFLLEILYNGSYDEVIKINTMADHQIQVYLIKDSCV